MEKNDYRFRRNETFYIRNGWFEKAINAIGENEKNIFYKNDGIEILGIGSNMVKGLKYWLQIANIIDTKVNSNILTNFGKLLYKYDRYLDEKFSWYLIHYFLAKNESDNAIFWFIFNNKIKSFTKENMVQNLLEYYWSLDETIKKRYIENDFNMFLKSYINEKDDGNPEDNYRCPLSSLKLLEKRNGIYTKTSPRYKDLSYLIVFYSLTSLFKKKSFNIEDSMYEKGGPCYLFNLDKNIYLQYLDEMKRNALITINKTAGLNMVYFEKDITLECLFEKYFGETNV